MKWAMVLLVLAASTGNTARIKQKSNDQVVEQVLNVTCPCDSKRDCDKCCTMPSKQLNGNLEPGTMFQFAGKTVQVPLAWDQFHCRSGACGVGAVYGTKEEWPNQGKWKEALTEYGAGWAKCDGTTLQQAAAATQPTIAKDEPAEKKQITPSRANGKVFYILGKSVVQNACFCYKLEIGKTLHQRTPAVTCPDSNKTETEAYSNERCKQEDTDWNVVIGEKQPVDKDNGMVQSYSEGTECEAAGKKRTSELTLISDKSAKELTITVTEPSTCAYNVEVSGPLAELVGEN